MRSRTLRFRLRVSSAAAGAPVRWDLDLDRDAATEPPPRGWIDPDSWVATHQGITLPLRADADTLDGRRYTLRFRAPRAGDYEVELAARLHPPPRPAPPAPPERSLPFVGAGEALALNARVGDLHLGLQTGVELVDWYGRGRLDLLATCHLHQGGAFLYSAVDGAGDGQGRPRFRLAGRLPGFGDDGQGYNGRLRAVDLGAGGAPAQVEPAQRATWGGVHGGGFDLLECGRWGVRWYRNVGRVGAPAFDNPRPLLAGGVPLDLGAPVQSLCAVDLGDGRPSLILGTNDWSDYWPRDAGAWDDRPGYRPYEADGTWRGGPLRGRLYLLRCLRLDAYGPSFGAPIPLCHGDGTPLEVYGLAGPAVIPAADPPAGFDLLVSDFLDRIWYFRGLVLTAADGVPRFAPRTPVRCHGVPVAPLDRMPVPPAPPADYPPAERLPDELILPTCMHALAVARWPGAAVDLVVGAEDGYVRAMRWTGRTPDGVPIVEPPARLQAYDAPLSVGAKACPTVVDLDGDGRPELLLGNAAGQVLLARHDAAAGELRYEAPVLVTAAGRPIWLMAGSPGTIQGPSEVKWGYVNPSAGDWPVPDATPCPAILCGDALGHNSLYLLTPDHSPSPSVTATRGRRLHLLRDGQWQPLVTRWRCRPQLVDWGDGETVYLQVDESGTLRCYRPLPDGPDAEDGTPRVAPLDVLRHPDGRPIRLDSDTGGAVGRLKLAVVDWDGDGLPDLLVGTNGRHPPGRNHLKRATVWLLRNTGAPGRPALTEPEILPLEAGAPGAFGGHSCVPAPAHFDSGAPRPGTRPDLLVGSENGRVYAYRRSYIEAQVRLTAAHLLS